MADEKTPQQPELENEDHETGDTQVTRRQFLVGAGVGAVVGAAGVGGVLTLAKPADTSVTKSAPAQPAATSQTASALPATMRQVTLNIDGKNYDMTVDVRTSLWEAMTFQLGMANSNLGCDRAQCGACAVLVDGMAVNSCTLLAARLGRGQKIMTVDGLSKGTRIEDLHPIQRAYITEGGFQCGMCTRGFVMSTYALLNSNPNPNEDEVREALSGNICRCSEYPKIFEAVFRAADEMRKKS
jgi:aerobic-type carbon monoxide dehydrogenase small subunit (CoxS/CutS family)